MYAIKQESEFYGMSTPVGESKEQSNERKHPPDLDEVSEPRGTEEVNVSNNDDSHAIQGLPPLDTAFNVHATFNMWSMETPDSAGSANFDQVVGLNGANTNDHHPGSTPPGAFASRVSSEEAELFFSSDNSIVPCGSMLRSNIQSDQFPITENNATPSGASTTVSLKPHNERGSSLSAKKAVAKTITGNRSTIHQPNHASIAEAAGLKSANLDCLSSSTMTKKAAITSSSANQASSVKSRPCSATVADHRQQAKVVIRSPGRDSFDIKLKLLKRYKEEHGHCDIAQSVYPLGTWVNKQRMEKKKFDKNEKSSMTLRRKRLLEELGFKWAEPKGQAAWERRFKELVEYKGKNGNCIVPTKYVENPALGRWLTTQRDQKKKGTIPKGNKRKLDAIGFVWDRYDNKKYQGKK